MLLPGAPELPLSYVATLSDRTESTPLDAEAPLEIIKSLTELLQSSIEVTEAKALLHRLRLRKDLTEESRREINRLLRGGSYNNLPRTMSSLYCHYSEWSDSYQGSNQGFRIATDL
ncbi:MAG: hypothetical protein JKY86_01480 [Gammaproteobacteria bacterium]|nr:hypothetical protein [Gammaproteobacteria bacterium]